MKQSVLNRLVAARHLIESSGPLPTAESISLVFAQKLLIAHDAAELVFFALLAYADRAVTGKDGQLIKEPSFRTLAEACIQRASEDPDFTADSMLQTFDDLLEARKRFKHGGLLIDPFSNRELFSDALSALDKLCITIIGQPLKTIDQTDAVDIVEAREWFVAAKNELKDGNFEKSLQLTARGLSISFFFSNTPSHLTAGDGKTEDALLLSGRGIDPASYISMQQLLPRTYFRSEPEEWELRRFGHEGNWTETNAEFCLRTAIGITIKLQASSYQPTADDFYDVYEDVVEIIALGATVFRVENSMFSFTFSEEEMDNFAYGDKIYGKASGQFEKTRDLPSENRMPFDDAPWIAIENPRTDRLPSKSVSAWGRDTLWVERKLVDITYQINEARVAAKKFWDEQTRDNP